MTETSATDAVVEKATKAAKTVSEALPHVVETAEIAMEVQVPTKVIFNQKLIVGVSVLGGMALGAGILYGVNKWRTRNRIEIEIPNRVDEETLKNGKREH